MSNEMVVTANSTSLASRPGRWASETRKLVTAWWLMITPLGLPVEPEVWIT